MKPILSPLPEFKEVRSKPIATPVRRALKVAASNLLAKRL
jgi:hypothetical protein